MFQYCCTSWYCDDTPLWGNSSPLNGWVDVYTVDAPLIILDCNLSPDLQNIQWLIFIIWLPPRLQMPSLFLLGPTHPDTNIISIYTHPTQRPHTHAAVCAAAAAYASSSRAKRRNGGQVRSCWDEWGTSSRTRRGQLVNTRWMSRRQRGAAGDVQRAEEHLRWFRLKQWRTESTFSESIHQDATQGCGKELL